MKVDSAGRRRPYTDAERASLDRARVWLGEHPAMVASARPPSGPLRTETDAQANARVATRPGVGGLSTAVLDSMTAAACTAVAAVLTRRRTADVYRQSALKGWYVR